MRLQRALAQRDHLKEQLVTVTITDYRGMLLQLLARVEAQIMASSSEAEFAAEIADGPFVNPVPVFPRRRLFLIMAVIGGSILGLLLVVFTPLSDDIFRRRSKRGANRG
jgi:uncharacterized protein involved in exopolysaccharide biosynthesis